MLSEGFNSAQLFSMALQLNEPWYVKDVKFGPANKNEEVLELRIEFKRGSRFPDASGALCPVHDTVERTWQHLNFFQHGCKLRCKVPRIRTKEGKVETVKVPWAREQSGFTLLFEAFVMILIEREMPINRIAETTRVVPNRIWRVFNHWVEKALSQDSARGMKRLGMDETSKRRGHDYVTLAVDLDKRRVVGVTEGKGKAAVAKVAEQLSAKDVGPEEIKEASIDLSPSYISGISEEFPKAKITYDRFHVVKLLNEAMDEVRRQEAKEHAMLKGLRYAFLKNEENLTATQCKHRDEAIELYPNLGKAYRLKVLFNDVWEMPDTKSATRFLKNWCAEVEAEKIPAFMRFAKTVRAHLTGIVRYVQTKISNGILEGINCKIQLAKRRARGYTNLENFINMIYFLCGKLRFEYPRYSL